MALRGCRRASRPLEWPWSDSPHHRAFAARRGSLVPPGCVQDASSLLGGAMSDRTNTHELFPADGWSTHLADTADHTGLVGLVSASRVPRTAGVSWHLWKAITQDVAPDAARLPRTRGRRPRGYFRPARVVQLLVERGLVAAGDAPAVLERLAHGAKSLPAYRVPGSLADW